MRFFAYVERETEAGELTAYVTEEAELSSSFADAACLRDVDTLVGLCNEAGLEEYFIEIMLEPPVA
jgi:hypothetical protein